MMNHRVFPALILFVVCLFVAEAYGHGEAIRVDAVDNRLVVGNGVLDDEGFVDRIFVETGVDGEPNGTGTLSGFGPAVYWNVPGFDIFGMSENSGLYLEVLARPVLDSDPLKERVLWYWNPATELIEDAPPDNHFQIRKSASVNRILTGTQSVAPTPLKIANPVAADMGYHNHTLLLFAIHRQLPPPAGAYGLFARFTSDQYAPSDPFLILVNNGFVSGDQMLEAALAINAAAVDSLAGDFNMDGSVDAADYTVWRDGLGSAYTVEHYLAWKNNFGTDSGGGAATASVPEPAILTLLCGISAGLLPIGRYGRLVDTFDDSFNSADRSGCFFLFCGAGVRFVRNDSDPAMMNALSTRDGNPHSDDERVIHESPF